MGVVKFDDVEVKCLFTVVQSWQKRTALVYQVTKNPSLVKTKEYQTQGMFRPDGQQPWGQKIFCFCVITTRREEGAHSLFRQLTVPPACCEMHQRAGRTSGAAPGLQVR